MAIGDRVREGRASRRVRKVDPKIGRLDQELKLGREVLRRIINSVSISENAAQAMVSNPSTIQSTVEATYKAIEKDVASVMGKGLKTGGDFALDNVQVLEFSFDLVNPVAVEWAEKRAGALITEMTSKQVTVIRGIIAEGTQAGQGALEVARNVKPSIGLHTRYANAVEKFREREARRLIAQHPRTPIGNLQARANKKADAYADRLLRARSKAIARTELMASANEGQRQAWRQASDAGELNLDDAQREYIATLNGHSLCDDQDGDLIDFDDEFLEGNPPIHTNCGCTEGLRGASVTGGPASQTQQQQQAQAETAGATTATAQEPGPQRDLTRGETSGLNSYKNEYRDINGALRDRKLSGLSTEKRGVIKQLDSSLKDASLQKDRTVYRGANLDSMFGKKAGGDLQSLVGTRMSDRAYVSTSRNLKVAESFASQSGSRGAIMEMRLPKGMRALDFDAINGTNPLGKVTRFGSFADEAEVLLPRGSVFQVTEVISGSGGSPARVIMEVVSGG